MTRREEKRLCAELAEAAAEVARSRLNYAELYMARLRLRHALEALLDANATPPAVLEAAE